MKLWIALVLLASTAGCATAPTPGATPGPGIARAPAAAPAAAAAPRELQEGEICGSDDVNGPSPAAAKCGPRLMCLSLDVVSGIAHTGRAVRRCESMPFFGRR